MNIPDITWRGESIDDVEILRDVPKPLLDILSSVNGFILHYGVIHFRGACHSPEWHSLRQAWRGQSAFSELYEEVEVIDVPFAEDQFGDQFLMRNGAILHLSAETGDVKHFCTNLDAFFAGIHADVENFLNASLNHRLEPSQLLLAYPPFCMKESGRGASLKACPTAEVIAFHASLARQIRDVPDGGQIEIRLK